MIQAQAARSSALHDSMPNTTPIQPLHPWYIYYYACVVKKKTHSCQINPRKSHYSSTTRSFLASCPNTVAPELLTLLTKLLKMVIAATTMFTITEGKDGKQL